MDARPAPYLPIIVINAALIAMAASGCSGGGRGGTRASVPAGPRTTSSGEIVLPIDIYAFKLSEVHQIRLARDLLSGQCMTHFGFTFNAAALTDRRCKTAEYDIKDHGEYGNKRRYGSPRSHMRPSTASGCPLRSTAPA